MSIQFEALASDAVESLRGGGLDAYGHAAERCVSNGGGTPCRHCLAPVAEGEPYLVLAHRPFTSPQPYAETGPIFLHAEACDRAAPSAEIPAILSSPEYIVRGYSPDERIVHGTGGVIARAEIPARAAELLADKNIAFVHVRSARNNCFQCRIERAPG